MAIDDIVAIYSGQTVDIVVIGVIVDIDVIVVIDVIVDIVL